MDEYDFLKEIDPESWAEYEEEQKLSEAEQAKILDDFKSVARTPEGMRVFREVLERLGLFRECFTGNSKTFYNLGRHESAQEIFSLLTLADPKAAQQVLLEGYRKAARQKVLKKGKSNE